MKNSFWVFLEIWGFIGFSFFLRSSNFIQVKRFREDWPIRCLVFLVTQYMFNLLGMRSVFRGSHWDNYALSDLISNNFVDFSRSVSYSLPVFSEYCKLFCMCSVVCLKSSSAVVLLYFSLRAVSRAHRNSSAILESSYLRTSLYIASIKYSNPGLLQTFANLLFEISIWVWGRILSVRYLID